MEESYLEITHLLLGDQFTYQNSASFKLLKEPLLTLLEIKESKFIIVLICIYMCCAHFRVSAGIFVDLEASPVPYLKLIRNVQCFIIHSDSNLIPNEWKNVKCVAELLYSG